MPLAKEVRTESEPLDSARTEVVQEDIRTGQQTPEDVAAALGLQIDRDRLLAAVEPDEMAGESADRMVVAAGEVTAVDALELDHPGAEVGEVS